MTGRPREDHALDVLLSVRLNAADVARLDAVTARVPLATRHAVARAALRIGLERIEADPVRVLADATGAPSTPAPKRRPRKGG